MYGQINSSRHSTACSCCPPTAPKEDATAYFLLLVAQILIANLKSISDVFYSSIKKNWGLEVPRCIVKCFQACLFATFAPCLWFNIDSCKRQIPLNPIKCLPYRPYLQKTMRSKPQKPASKHAQDWDSGHPKDILGRGEKGGKKPAMLNIMEQLINEIYLWSKKLQTSRIVL